jgi:hypothetical protein
MNHFITAAAINDYKSTAKNGKSIANVRERAQKNFISRILLQKKML